MFPQRNLISIAIDRAAILTRRQAEITGRLKKHFTQIQVVMHCLELEVNDVL